MAVNDDEIIKKRLLIDGDGGNDDKRITNLLKTLIRWCHSSESDEESFQVAAVGEQAVSSYGKGKKHKDLLKQSQPSETLSCFFSKSIPNLDLDISTSSVVTASPERQLSSQCQPTSNRLTCQRMLATLAQCEHTMEKSATVYQMNLKEQVNYDNLSREIEEKIQAAVEKINECKNELQQAKRIRKHRQEYDALAKVIQQHPDRQDTMKKLEMLDKELAVLEGTKESLEHKLDMRRKQFHVLIAAIHELQSVIEEDEKTSEMDTT